MDQLLSGTTNFCFGNPTAQLWQDISSGAAAPRVRRQHELLLQIKQQLAAVALRSYHNQQVSTFLAMQRVWDSTLPAEAPMSARLEAWNASQAGKLDVPESPRQAVQAAWAAEMHSTPEKEQHLQTHTGGTASSKQHGKHSSGEFAAAAGAHQMAAGAAEKKASAVTNNNRDYVYETGVDFSKHLTKRQQSALTQQQPPAVAPGAGHPVVQYSTQLQQQQLLQHLQRLQQQQQASTAASQAGMVPAGPQAAQMQQQQLQMRMQQAQLPPQMHAQLGAQQQQQVQAMLLQRQVQLQQQQQP